MTEKTGHEARRAAPGAGLEQFAPRTPSLQRVYVKNHGFIRIYDSGCGHGILSKLGRGSLVFQEFADAEAGSGPTL